MLGIRWWWHLDHLSRFQCQLWEHIILGDVISKSSICETRKWNRCLRIIKQSTLSILPVPHDEMTYMCQKYQTQPSFQLTCSTWQMISPADINKVTIVQLSIDYSKINKGGIWYLTKHLYNDVNFLWNKIYLQDSNCIKTHSLQMLMWNSVPTKVWLQRYRQTWVYHNLYLTGGGW